MREYADPRRHDLGKFGPGDDRYHAMRFLCSFDGDFDNTSMGVRRTYKSDLHHARQRYVADILSAPLRQTLQIWPRHRTADVRVRPVERSQDGWGVFGDLHWAAKPHKNRVGHKIVRHICAEGLLSRPRPSLGCLKLRPMMSTKSSRLTLALGSNE